MSKRLATEQRRPQVAAAALQVIAEEGLGRFTTAAIARAAGLSEGALFKHFGSKDEVVEAAMQLVESRLFADFPPRHPDPWLRLRALFVARLELVSAEPVVGRVVFSDQLEHALGPQGAARVAKWKAKTLRFVKGCLVEAAAAGQLRPGVDPQALVTVVHGSLLSLAMGAVRGKNTRAAVLGQGDAVWRTLERLICESPP